MDRSQTYLPGDARGLPRRSAELEETRNFAKRDASDAEENGVVCAVAATETEAEEETEEEETAAAEQRRGKDAGDDRASSIRRKRRCRMRASRRPC